MDRRLARLSALLSAMDDGLGLGLPEDEDVAVSKTIR